MMSLFNAEEVLYAAALYKPMGGTELAEVGRSAASPIELYGVDTGPCNNLTP